MTKTNKAIPWYMLPFWAIWKLVEGIVLFAGRLVAVVLGGVLMLAGILVSLTVIGAVIGIPLAILGFLLVLRGLF
jgi:hypothetical protein